MRKSAMEKKKTWKGNIIVCCLHEKKMMVF